MLFRISLIWGWLLCFALALSNGCNNFSLMSYNIHGLPMFMTFDPTYKRIETISKKYYTI